jgi:hypothetical protein
VEGVMKVWIEKAPWGTTTQGKYLICCDKTKFSYESKAIIGRLYRATLTDAELEEIKEKIEEALK